MNELLMLLEAWKDDPTMYPIVSDKLKDLGYPLTADWHGFGGCPRGGCYLVDDSRYLSECLNGTSLLKSDNPYAWLDHHEKKLKKTGVSK